MFKHKKKKQKNASNRFSRKANIFYIRLTVIIVMAYMLVVESSSVIDDRWSYLYIVFYFGTNLVISKLPNEYFHYKYSYYLLAAFDTLMITLGLFLIGQADSYFFVVYFLIIGISAMSRNLKYLMLNTLMFIIIYAWILYMFGHFHGDNASRYALQIPFIWSFALLLGYIIDCLIQEVNKSIGDLQEKYNSLVQSINSPIFMMDPNGHIIYANDKMLSGLKKTREEVLNKYFNELYSPEESELFQSNLNYVIDNNEPTQFMSYNQNEDKWFLNVLSPVKESTTSAIEAASVVSKDITENVKNEKELRQAYDRLKQTQDKLIQKNKMEVVGRMASGIAHQIRNPLEIIYLGVEFLEDLGYRNDKYAKKSIEKIKNATQRTQRIIEDVLQFSRSSNFDLKPINIKNALEESIDFIQHKLVKSNIKVETSFSDPNLHVQADKTALQQVFLNIVNNAVQAMGNNGKLSIYTYLQRISSDNFNSQSPRKCFLGYSIDSWKYRRKQCLSCLQQSLARSKYSSGKLVILLVQFKFINSQTGEIYNEFDEQMEKIIERHIGDSIRNSDSMTCITHNMYMFLLQDIPDLQTSIRVVDRLHNIMTTSLAKLPNKDNPYVIMGYTIHPDGGSDIKQLLKQARAALDIASETNRMIVNYHDSSAHNDTLATNPAKIESDSENPQANPSSWLIVEIRDNGPGMSEEVASNIFEPFYTTKQADEGTGLGLSLASQIIERHHGQIELDTKENIGTTFRIKLLQANQLEGTNE